MYFLLILLGWILGIATMGQFFSSYWNVIAPLVFVLTLLFIVLRFAQAEWSQSLYYRCAFAVLLSLSSFLCGQFYADFQLKQRLDKRELEIASVEAVIYIEQINQWILDDPSGAKIRQKATVLNQKHSPVQWTLNIKEDLPHSDLSLGQYYLVSGKLRPAHSYAVSGAFDVEKWMLQENIMGSLQVKEIQPISSEVVKAMGYQSFIQQQENGFNAFRLVIEQKRLDFRYYLFRQPFQQKGLLLALLTGDESLLSKETQQLFKRLGISHLLAISGPHVLIFAVLFCFVLNLIIRRVAPRIYLKIPRPYLLILPFLGCVWLYTAFVGFEIPALRTLLTVMLMSTVILIKQKLRALSILLLSAALLLLFDPFSILSAAFWLSYGACFILIRVYQTIQQNKELSSDEHIKTWRDDLTLWLKIFVESQWKIFIALFPLVILIFQQVSWAAPFANLLAIPLIGILIVPLEVLGAFSWLLFEPLGFLFFQIADWCLQLLLLLLGQLDIFMVASLNWLALSPAVIWIFALGVFILFLPRGIVPKGWALLCLIPLFSSVRPTEEFKLNILDVGQGQAIYLHVPHQTMLIDTGGYYDEAKFSVGQQIIVPHLMQLGQNKLDRVILTHLDQDHSGAFSRVADEIKISQVLSNQQDERFKSYPFDYCHAGQSWNDGQIKIEVLSPQVSDLSLVPYNQNEYSCVLYIQVPQAEGYQNFLLMGDAGWEAEYRILQRYPNLKVDVLVLGHHGSQHSSSFAFLKQLQPRLAIISAGFGNRYGHPSPATLARLQALNIPFMSTIQHGSIEFTMNADHTMQIQTARAQKKWLLR